MSFLTSIIAAIDITSNVIAMWSTTFGLAVLVKDDTIVPDGVQGKYLAVNIMIITATFPYYYLM